MLTPIEGRAALVTGGTKGIGRGIALAFARNGAKVMVTGRDPAAGAACAAELVAAGASDAAFVAADTASRDDCVRAADATAARFGGIDIVVANAGIYPESMIESMPEDELRRMIDVNLTGTIMSVQACLPHVRRSDHGRVVVISSITGPIVGMEANAHYAASKAGQLGFVRSAALEFAPMGITVNAVLPGNVATEGLDELGREYQQAMLSAIPQGRLGAPDDVAGAVLFLVSDEASFITGQSIIVDGGQVLPEGPLRGNALR